MYVQYFQGKVYLLLVRAPFKEYQFLLDPSLPSPFLYKKGKKKKQFQGFVYFSVKMKSSGKTVSECLFSSPSLISFSIFLSLFSLNFPSYPVRWCWQWSRKKHRKGWQIMMLGSSITKKDQYKNMSLNTNIMYVFLHQIISSHFPYMFRNIFFAWINFRS